MTRSTPRRSRIKRRCDCGQIILPGDPYLECVASPDHGEIGNVGWWRIAECYLCAVRRDREHLFDPRRWGEFAAHAYYGTWNVRPTVVSAA